MQTEGRKNNLKDLDFIESPSAKALSKERALEKKNAESKTKLEAKTAITPPLNELEKPLKNHSKSGTIEALISQNEDLMARLKVTLRRLAIIEDEKEQILTESKNTQSQFSSLTDQLLVLKEKDEVWRTKFSHIEKQFHQIKSSIRIKEMEFAEMRAQVADERQKLWQEFNSKKNRLLRLEKFRIRIHRWVKPLIAKKENELSQIQDEKARGEKKIIELEAKLEAMSRQTELLIKNAREQVRNIEEERIQLVDRFEKERSDLTTELNGLRDSTGELRKKALALEDSLKRQDYLENRIIGLERNQQEMLEFHQMELTSTGHQLAEYRSLANQLKVQNENLKSQNQEFEQKALNYQKHNLALEEQLSAIRTLWSEKSTEVEKLQNTNQALERLNAELSTKLNAKN